MITLHAFQQDMKIRLFASWQAGNPNVITVAPTGAGKTILMSSVAHDVNQPLVAIAHRQELVQQISLALGAMGVYHNIIASDAVVRTIITQHVHKFGRSFHNQQSLITVASVDTLIIRAPRMIQWCNSIRYWVIDEGHHCLPSNKWGRATSLFPNARGVGFTASPLRADKKSLGAEQGGIFHHMVIGPSARWLIDKGYLSDYRIYGPPQSIDTAKLKMSKSTGDYMKSSLSTITEESTITGDIVKHYKRLAMGKRGITFVVDVKAGIKAADAFNEAGVPAEMIHGKTPDVVRNDAIRKFEDGKILQLVNVDLFGEGFDVPAVECVSMGRPTQSLGLYLQQFGRALRSSPGKTHGIVIDHVGNVPQHNLPDIPRAWSLTSDRHAQGTSSNDIEFPATTCVSCFQAFQRRSQTCPWCGHYQEPEGRSDPKFVDGDLIEFDEEFLAQLRASAINVDEDYDPPVPLDLVGTPAEAGIVRKFGEKKLAQIDLREAISYWAGIRRDKGMTDSEIYRKFYLAFGCDVISAQGLLRKEAEALSLRIKGDYW